jgi:hypothetical protein
VQLAGPQEVDGETELTGGSGHAVIVAEMPSESARTLRFVIRLRTLTETECYARCYGGWDPTVTVVKLEPRRPRYELSVTGEDLRRGFEARIDARPEDAEAEAA